MTEDRASEDRDLVRLALAGDDVAFARIVRRYERGLFNLALRMVHDPEQARDLTQEIFVRVHRSLARYDPVYPFPSWIYRVASNLCIDWIRRRKVETVSLDAPLPGGEEDAPSREFEGGSLDPSEEMERRERMSILAEALSALPESHRLVLLLRHQRELSYEEIAVALDVPLGTVKARIHRARQALRDVLLEGDRLKDLEP